MEQNDNLMTKNQKKILEMQFNNLHKIWYKTVVDVKVFHCKEDRREYVALVCI